MIVLDDHDGTRNEAGTWASLGDLGNLSASRDDKTVDSFSKTFDPAAATSH